MTGIPPSRYRVVERGRRLVVIDTRTGRPATHDPAPPGPDPAAAAQPHREPTSPGRIGDRSDVPVLTTSPLYDLKGPRRIVLDDGFRTRIGKAAGGWLIGLFIALIIVLLFFPWLIVLPVVLLIQRSNRAAIRQWITARLDALQAAR